MGTTQVLPIDWHTLAPQLAALVLVVASIVLGFHRVAGRRVSWFSAIASRRSHRVSLMLRCGERFVVAVLVFTGGFCAILIGQFIFDDYAYSGDEWSYLLQAKIFSQGRLHTDSPAH